MSNGNDNNILSIDLSIFNRTDGNDNIKCKSSISGCKCIQRVIAGLLYYQIINKSSKDNDNHNGQTIFEDFLFESYQHYLDDIIHVKAA